MNTSSFDMFHDTWNIYIRAICDRIDFTFLTKDITVNQNRRIMRDFLNGCCHINLQFFIVIDDFHGSSTKHIGRSDKNRISDLMCNCKGFLNRIGCHAFRLRDTKLIEHRFKFMSVFCLVDGIQACTKNSDTMFFQTCRKVDGSLTTELYNDTDRLFQINDMHDIFCC